MAQKGHRYFSTIVCIFPAYYNFLKKHFDFFFYFHPGGKYFHPGGKYFNPGGNYFHPGGNYFNPGGKFIHNLHPISHGLGSLGPLLEPLNGQIHIAAKYSFYKVC